MTDRTAARREALRSRLKPNEVEAFLVLSQANVGYLTGFSGSDATVLITPERSIVLSDGRYATQLSQECPDLEIHIRPIDRTMIDAIAEVIGKLGHRRVAFEALHLTVAHREDLGTKAPTVEWRATRDWVEDLRVVKDDVEVAAIREAIACAETAFTAMLAGLDLTWSEKRLADDLEAAMRRLGATGSSFPPIVAVGRNAALPHYQPGDSVRLGENDFTLIDWGASGRPYKSDLTRVVVTGKVSSRFEEVYRIVLSAQERALEAIHPGVSAHVVDNAARSVIDAGGYGPYFDHGLGHGLGREIHEAPRIRQGSETRLQPGMVVTIEPGIYLPGWGGIRIEDDVLVTPDGCEVLSRLPKSLDAIRLS
jgi:Xaa-Pro aminopeptidase